MPNRFLLVVTILTVIFTAGVICFAFKDVQNGGQSSSELQSTITRYWRVAKTKTLDFAAPILNTFGVNVNEGRISAEDSEAAKYLKDASEAVGSAINSVTR